MQNKNVAFLCPQLPPTKGGVSDHSTRLIKQFIKNNYNVTSYTFTKNSNNIEQTNIKHIEIPKKSTQQKTFIEELQRNNINKIIIQYTPLSLNPNFYGFNFWLIFFLVRLKINKINTILIAHECNYPINFTLRGLTIGPIHFFQFFLINLLSKNTIFSISNFTTFWNKFSFFKTHKGITVPVGSNFLPRESINNDKEYIIYFGGKHPTQYNDLAIKWFNGLQIKFPKLKLVILGIKENDVKFAPNDNIIFPGHLTPHEISSYYSKALLALAPLMDGVSTRRGTAMCSFAHQVPLVTNIGYSSNKDIPWEKFCFTVPLNSTNFDQITDKNIQLKISETKNYFSSHFSWDAIFKQINHLLL